MNLLINIYNVFLENMIKVSNWLWGDPLLILLGVGGLYITIRIGFVQFKYHGYAWKLLFNDIFKKKPDEELKSTGKTGTISSIQAISSALASCVGSGNITGVPLAIYWGGPGAVFWMWIIGITGMGTKFTEIVLGMKYRRVNEDGEYVGGPQYYLGEGLKKYKLQWLGWLFALSLILEATIDVMVQSNSMVASVYEAFKIPPIFTGLLISVFCAYALFGGIKRIGKISEKIVGIMATLFTVGSLLIILLNIKEIPQLFGLIFRHAFTPMAAVGGFAGATVASAMRWGMARGAYSNEAGCGTAPIAHSAAIVDHPVRQGMYGVVEVFIDTIIICSCAAFVVLLSGMWTDVNAGVNPGALTTIAFGHFFGPLGKAFIAIILSMFVLTTVMVYPFFGEKQAEFLGGKKVALFIRLVFIGCIFIGTFWDAEYLWPFLDIAFAFMIIPNMIGVIILVPEVGRMVKEYFNTPGKYYLADNEKAMKKKAADN